MGSALEVLNECWDREIGGAGVAFKIIPNFNICISKILKKFRSKLDFAKEDLDLKSKFIIF